MASTPKKTTPGSVFLLGALIVFGSFCVNSKLAEQNQLSTNQLTAIYTGLGFSGLVATFWHQREQAIDAEKEQGKLLAEMRAQAKAVNQSVWVNALLAKMNYCQIEFEKVGQKTGGYKIMERQIQLGEEITRIKAELDRVIASYVP